MFICLYFYTLSAIRVLSSFGELCIMRAAAENSFARVLNHMGERIYCHPQKDCFVLSELFRMATQVGRLKPGSKTVQLYVRLSMRPLGMRGEFNKLPDFFVQAFKIIVDS